VTAPGTQRIEAVGSLLVHLHTGKVAGSGLALAVGFECPTRDEDVSIKSAGTCVSDYQVQSAANDNLCLEGGLVETCADGVATQKYSVVPVPGRSGVFRLLIGGGFVEQCLLAGRGARVGPCTASRALWSSTRVDDGTVRLHAPEDLSNCLMIQDRVLYGPCPDTGLDHLFRFSPVLSSLCPATPLRLQGGSTLTTCFSAGRSPLGSFTPCGVAEGGSVVIPSVSADAQVGLVIRDGDKCFLSMGLWGSCENVTAFSVDPLPLLRGSVHIKSAGKCLTLMLQLERLVFVDCDEKSSGQRFQLAPLL
jgi:hypothetical protein